MAVPTTPHDQRRARQMQLLPRGAPNIAASSGESNALRACQSKTHSNDSGEVDATICDKMRHFSKRPIASQLDISVVGNFIYACDMPSAAMEGVASGFWGAKLL